MNFIKKHFKSEYDEIKYSCTYINEKINNKSNNIINKNRNIKIDIGVHIKLNIFE